MTDLSRDQNGPRRMDTLIRKLVEKIGVTPVEEDGRKSLSIDLHSHLAGILSRATKAKRPLAESGLEVRYTKIGCGERI